MVILLILKDLLKAFERRPELKSREMDHSFIVLLPGRPLLLIEIAADSENVCSPLPLH